MLKPFLVLMQKELIGLTDPIPQIHAAGHRVTEISASENWRERLGEIEAELSGAKLYRPLLFVSLDLARHVKRHCPCLSRGLILDPEKLRVHRWSGFLPADLLLNRSFILLPFGSILSRKAQLERIFGSRIFLRPDSSMKEFPGLCLDIESIDAEISFLRQVYRPDPDLLCVIDKARKLPTHEYRFWLADGEVLCSAAYAFGPGGVDPTVSAPPCPALLWDTARDLARRLEIWENPVVADLVCDEDGTPRLVEINGFSTSGFYPGVNISAILSALEEMMCG